MFHTLIDVAAAADREIRLSRIDGNYNCWFDLLSYLFR